MLRCSTSYCFSRNTIDHLTGGVAFVYNSTALSHEMLQYDWYGHSSSDRIQNDRFPLLRKPQLKGLTSVGISQIGLWNEINY